MYKGKKIGVVVPSYNVAHLVGRVIETMPDLVDRTYIIDDESHDDTYDVAAGHKAALDGRLDIIRNEVNLGVGGAIVRGYKQALADGMDIIAVMAGDAQMDPDDLPKVLDPVAEGQADYVKGNRLFTGESWKIIPKYRYLGNSFLSLLTKIASGYWHVADSQTGYTAISREALAMLPLDSIYSRYGYPNDVLVNLNVFNFRVKDVPVRPVYNIGEKSGIRLWNVIPKMSWLLLKRFFWRLKEKYVIRDFHPLVFFYLAGALLSLACAALTVRMFVSWGIHGHIPKINALACMTSFTASIQFLLFAMWFDMESNKDLK